MKKIRIKFWFIGALHTKRTYATVDTEVDEETLKNDRDWIMSRLDDIIADFTNSGAIDHLTDAGIQNFGVSSYQTKGFKGQADFIEKSK